MNAYQYLLNNILTIYIQGPCFYGLNYSVYKKKGLRILSDTEIQPPKVLPSTKSGEPKTDLNQEPVFAEEECKLFSVG